MFRDVDTAFRWGWHNPENFLYLPSRRAQALMIVYCETVDQMKYVQDKEQANEIERTRSSG